MAVFEASMVSSSSFELKMDKISANTFCDAVRLEEELIGN